METSVVIVKTAEGAMNQTKMTCNWKLLWETHCIATKTHWSESYFIVFIALNVTCTIMFRKPRYVWTITFKMFEKHLILHIFFIIIHHIHQGLNKAVLCLCQRYMASIPCNVLLKNLYSFVSDSYSGLSTATSSLICVQYAVSFHQSDGECISV